MDETLVQHAENNVDGHEGRQNQQPLVRLRALEGGGRALVGRDDAGRHLQLGDGAVDGIQGLPERVPGAQIEGDRDGGKLSLASNGQRLALRTNARECT